MSVNGWLQIGFFVGILTLLTPVLGTYMAKVYSGERVFLTPILAPVERLFYRAVGTSTDRGQDWNPTPARCSSSAPSRGCCST